MWGRVLQTLSQEAAYIHDARFDAPSRGVKERMSESQIVRYRCMRPIFSRLSISSIAFLAFT